MRNLQGCLTSAERNFMNMAEMLQILQSQPRRHYYMRWSFVIIVEGMCAAFCVVWIFAPHLTLIWPWFRDLWFFALPASFLGVASAMSIKEAKQRWCLSRIVANNPQMVYWAHAELSFPPSALEKNCTRLLLHLRNGERLTVVLNASKMREFIGSLRAENPRIRWGSFDSSPGNVDTLRIIPS